MRCGEAKPSCGKDPGHSPLLFQADCRSQRWAELRQGYSKRANSSAPSQRALCCARHGCWRAPAYHLPGTAPDRATAPADSVAPCPGQTWVLSWRLPRLPTPTEHPEPFFPVPDAWHIVLLLSPQKESPPTETTWYNNMYQLPNEKHQVSRWAASAAPRQIFFWHVPSSPPPGSSLAACCCSGSCHATSRR